MNTNSYLRKPAILTIILISYAMLVIDVSIAITALPKIKRDLSFSESSLTWVQNSYTLAFGGLLLLGSRAGDILGRRRMLIIGLATFSAASLAIGITESSEIMLAARALQGAGAAILAPSTLAFLSSEFAEGPSRNRAFSYYAATVGISASIGLVIGGLIADFWTWRIGFLVNVPIGAVLIAMSRKYIRETQTQRGEFDASGAVLSTLSMSTVVYGLVHISSEDGIDKVSLSSIAIGFVLLILLIFNERRAPQPIMPLWIFLHRRRAAAYITRALFLGAMMGFWFFLTQYLQNSMLLSAWHAGLAFLPVTLSNLLSALFATKVGNAIGQDRMLFMGLFMAAVGLYWLGQIHIETSYLTGVALPMALIGMGQGFALVPLTTSGLSEVRDEYVGAASGIVNVSHQIGAALGLGFLIIVFKTANDDTVENTQLFVEKIRATLVVGSAMTMSSIVIFFTMTSLSNQPFKGLKF